MAKLRIGVRPDSVVVVVPPPRFGMSASIWLINAVRSGGCTAKAAPTADRVVHESKTTNNQLTNNKYIINHVT